MVEVVLNGLGVCMRTCICMCVYAIRPTYRIHEQDDPDDCVLTLCNSRVCVGVCVFARTGPCVCTHLIMRV